jgi:hypothetical protein
MMALNTVESIIEDLEDGLDDDEVYAGGLCEGCALDVLDEMRSYRAALKAGKDLPATPVYDKWITELRDIISKQEGN